MNLRFKLYIIVLCGVLIASQAYSLTATRSIDHLVSSNGHGLISFDLQSRTVDTFLPTILRDADPETDPADLIEQASFKIQLGNVQIDLSTLPIKHAEYVNGTGIIRLDYQARSLKMTAYYMAPMILEHKVMFMLLHVEDTGNTNITCEKITPYAISGSPFIKSFHYQDTDGKSFWVGQSIAYYKELAEETVSQLFYELENARPRLLLEAEQRWWMHWHRLSYVPKHIVGSKYDLLKQSAAFLKMAQNRQAGGNFGQIVNTLSPIYRSVASPRDMAYGIVALARIGKYTEAREALEYLLKFYHGSAYPDEHGISYNASQPLSITLANSVQSHYPAPQTIARGTSEQIDGQGLVLWAISEYVRESSDVRFAAKYFSIIKNDIAAKLIDSIDETGLACQNSGSWNQSTPDEHFSFTSIACYHGLNNAALLAKIVDQHDLAFEYTKHAADLRNTILTDLTIGKSKLLSRSLEIKTFPYCLDGSSVEAINFNLVKPYWKTARTTSQSLDLYLKSGPGIRGYSHGYLNKNEKMPESPFITLRALSAIQQLGENVRASHILNWVMSQSQRNAGMIPEYYSLDTATYQGAYPLIGRGAGAFILSLCQK